MSQTEYASWGIAVVIVVVMGFIALHGPFKYVNKGIAASGPANRTTVQVIIGSDPKNIGAYIPKTVTVHPGTYVDFKNFSDASHTVTSIGGIDSGDIAINQTWTFFASTPGTYDYYCRYHPGMYGTIKVK